MTQVHEKAQTKRRAWDGPENMKQARPIIGITVDVVDGRCAVSRAYADMVIRAGGATPILLAPDIRLVDSYLALCDGFVFTGGDDPRMEPFGVATHPEAKLVNDDRQAFETALLQRVGARPTLGVCLGMQLMALTSGGGLDQHLPDLLATHETHWGKRTHRVEGAIGNGEIQSHHRQAVNDPGSLDVVASAPDGVIEAIRDSSRPFFVGVQWHPERSGDGPLGAGLFAELVRAARAR